MKWFHTILLLCLVSLSKGVNVFISGYSGMQMSIYQVAGGTSKAPIEFTKDFDLHPCNGSLYWWDLENNILYKQSLNSSGDVPIISTDIHQPMSVAVDWKGNNIYFSHRFGDSGPSRIEVVSADGRSRKVLVSPLDYYAGDDIYLALSITTGRLYYTYNNQIYSVDADGQNNSPIYTAQCTPSSTSSVRALTLDPFTNILYWTDCGDVIRWMDVRTPSITGTFSLGSSFKPFRIAALNDSFYWTGWSESGGGAVYRADQPRNRQTLTRVVIWASNTTTPYSLRVSADGFVCPQDGCAARSGGCGSLCLTTPAGPTCACPTGRVIINNVTCPAYPRTFMLFSKNFPTRSEIRVLSFDLGEGPPFPHIDYMVPIAIMNANANYLAFDTVTKRIYWIEQGFLGPPVIKRAFLDGSGVEVFINTSISDPRNLAIDSSSRNIYWVDTDFRAIMVASLNNPSLRTVVVTVDDHAPVGIDLDISRGYLFWSVAGGDARLQRSFMDGSNQSYLSRARRPGYVASDPTAGLVYWIDRYSVKVSSIYLEENEIAYVNSTANQVTVPSILGFTAMTNTLNDVLDVTVFGQWIYWSDAYTGSLLKTSKLAAQQITVVNPINSGNVCGLAAVNTTLSIVQTGCNLNNGNCAQLCLPTGQVTRPTCACALHLSNVNGQCVAASNQVVLATATSIIVKRISSTPVSELWTTSLTLNVQGVKSLAVSASSQLLYWIDTAQKSIYSANISGMVATPRLLVSCLSEPTDLAMDWAGMNIYWTDAVRKVIEVAKATDGSGRMVLSKMKSSPNQLALDPRRGLLYYIVSEDTTPKIYQLLMNGSGTQIVFWTGDPREGTLGSLHVAYRNTSFTPDALYWVMRNSATNRSVVYQASLEGTSPTPTVILTVDNLTSSIAVLGDFLYYTYGGNLAVTKKSLLDPSVINTNDYDIGNIGSAVADMQFLSYTLQPDIHKCSAQNEFCTGINALCLSNGISSGTCLCPPRTIKYNTVPTTSNAVPSYICTDDPTFLLISTADTIYYLHVLPPNALEDKKPQHFPLSIGPLYNVSAIAFDSNRERVLWADSGSGVIGITGLYGSQCEVVTTLSNLVPNSLAYDWKGNNIFLTEQNRYQVEIISRTGVKVLLGDLMSYQDLAMNYDLQVLYVRVGNSTVYNVSLATPTVLNKMYPLSGTANLSNMVYQSSNNALLWVNLNTSTIEMFFVANQSISVIARNVGNVAGLAAVGSDVLWLNTADSKIYRYSSSSGVSFYYTWPPELKVTDFIGVQDSDTTLTNLPCYTNPCSDICLFDSSAPETVLCSCPLYKTLATPTSRNCSALQCTGVEQFLCKDGSSCIPSVYFCDGINHCRDASDEINSQCPCANTGMKLCPGGGTLCLPRNKFCDGFQDCPLGTDESPLQCGCQATSDFKCYRNNLLICLNLTRKCDGSADCDDNSDENNCVTATTTTASTSIPGSQTTVALSTSTYIVIFIALVIVIVLVGAAITWCITSFVLHRRKYARPQKVEQQSLNGRTSCMSPQQRSDSTSQYSGTSMGTHSTLLGGVHSDGTGVKRCVSIDLDNPPPSPITMHHYDLPIGPESGENVSTISQPMPAVPNPSMNFSVADGISDGMSISVSQRNFPINGTTALHHDTRVLYRRVPGPVYSSSQSNGTTLYAPPQYGNKYRETVQFRHDADARSISTISSSTLGTENPEQYGTYDDMDHDAPPPSPVTEVSIPQYTFPANSPLSTSGYLESQF